VALLICRDPDFFSLTLLSFLVALEDFFSPFFSFHLSPLARALSLVLEAGRPC